MDTRGDAMECFDDETTIHILEHLDAAIDVARASLVCRSWRQFVLRGRLWRRLCLAEHPELKGAPIEVPSSNLNSSNSSSSEEEEALETEHRLYCHLRSELAGPPDLERSCIESAIAASSTDNEPHESIRQTLYPGPRVLREHRFLEEWSYWSSKGQLSTDVPETLTYRLISPLCVVHEINIRPFQAEFQIGNPVYSSKFVRFRLGMERSGGTENGDLGGDCVGCDDVQEYRWAYESPLFPMEQEDELQSFKLPRPVLCMGQILQLEFLGRVQTQDLDSLYYICICHVSVVGRPISSFDFNCMGDKQRICASVF